MELTNHFFHDFSAAGVGPWEPGDRASFLWLEVQKPATGPPFYGWRYRNRRQGLLSTAGGTETGDRASFLRLEVQKPATGPAFYGWRYRNRRQGLLSTARGTEPGDRASFLRLEVQNPVTDKRTTSHIECRQSTFRCSIADYALVLLFKVNMS